MNPGPLEKAQSMRPVKLLSILVALAITAFACGNAANTNQSTGNANTTQTANTNTAPQATPTPDAALMARTIYAAECARCHGINGDGGTPTILGKKLKVPSLKKGHALSHSDAEMVKIVTDGEEAMPSFKEKLKPDEITALVRMIRQEFQGGSAKK